MTAPGTHRLWLILLVAAALLVRLGWGLSRPSQLAADLPDQAEYLAIAQNMVAGNGMRFHDARFDADVVAFRAPGYPILMAGCGASVWGIRLVQAMLDASVVLAAYLLARRFLDGPWLALLAAGLVAFNPYLVYFSGLILSETLFTALLAWGLVLVTRRPPPEPVAPPPAAPAPVAPRSAIPMERRDVPLPPPPEPEPVRRPIDWAPWAGAVVLALAVLTRPGAMILPAAVMAVAAWATGRSIVRRTLIGAAVTFVVLLPWAARNRHLLGEWVWTTTNAGHTAYDGFGPSATGASNLLDLRQMRELKLMGELGRDRALGEAARDAMTGDWPRSAKLAAIKIARTWSPMPLSEGYGSGRNRAIGLAYTLPLFALTLGGLLNGRIPVRVKALCLLPAIYFTAVVAVSVGSLRYRIPAEPPMAVVAAAALMRGTYQGTRGK